MVLPAKVPNLLVNGTQVGAQQMHLHLPVSQCPARQCRTSARVAPIEAHPASQVLCMPLSTRVHRL